MALVLLGVLALAGCARPRNKPTARQPVMKDPSVLVAYVACALAPAIQQLGAKFAAENPGRSLQIEAGDPAALVRKIENGSIPDLFICLGDSEIGLLDREGLVERSSRREFGSYHLVLAWPASRAAISGYQELTSEKVKSMVMPTPGITSLGTDGKRALERLKLWGRLQGRLLLRGSAGEALLTLAKGEAEAGLLYRPCPALAATGEGAAITLPQREAIPANAVALGPPLAPGIARPTHIHIGVHKRSPKAGLAQRFISFLGSDQMKPELTAAGIPTE